VTVFERETQAGGHLSVLAQLPTREPWASAVREMVQALGAAGGELKLQAELTSADPLGHSADVLVLATGSRWSVPSSAVDSEAGDAQACAPASLPLDQAIELASRQQLALFGRHTMIVDGSGTYAPLGLADLLLSLGVRVTFVTGNPSIGHVAADELELQHVLPRLEQGGMRSITAHRVERAERSTTLLEPVAGGSVRVVPAVDAIVYSVLRVPANNLWLDLRDRRTGVYCIGDAASPRTTAAVIHEGEELARSL